MFGNIIITYKLLLVIKIFFVIISQFNSFSNFLAYSMGIFLSDIMFQFSLCLNSSINCATRFFDDIIFQFNLSSNSLIKSIFYFFRHYIPVNHIFKFFRKFYIFIILIKYIFFYINILTFIYLRRRFSMIIHCISIYNFLYIIS
ncbi:hypothetical protein AHEV_118 [Adoxophyes honmai entomopoxvirus 'L']|uniref:Uncharacterized protein n=1 Tax=Adoxophyes honmai entomopoxvirus 'L' TaxID=1293540 RepID=A0A916P0V5_9POXV|nr:hypothetical protein AHEV_118 [Adoxophyes honmai entomopoxvirus 'L']CCU55439.1 hypothetical protein AHEV_118 [Adoxophyes honmai entomopoxvirus 'L']